MSAADLARQAAAATDPVNHDAVQLALNWDGIAAGRRGRTRALQHCPPGWVDSVCQVVHDLAASGPLCVEDVRAECRERHIEPPPQPNAWGAVFTMLAVAGRIRRTGNLVQSARPAARGRRVAEWVGV